MAASETQLNELHDLVAQYLTKKVRGAAEDIDKKPTEADPMVRTISAAELAVATAMLKNNNITCKKNVGSALDELDKVLKASQNKGATPSEEDIAAAMERMEFNQQH